MSSQCNHFVQNAWKKDLCSNCFKSREEHLEDNSKNYNTVRMTTMTTTKMSNVDKKPQGILKGKTSSKRKKNVGFPDSLTEVIGYGGDDFSDSEEFELSESLGIEDSSADTEEERALCNLTRANTNFNTVTANLTGNTVTDSKKSFASLMLGKPRKDSEGKKKTLLVSVTPFGGDDLVPSAKRPSERKTNFSASNFSSNFNALNSLNHLQISKSSEVVASEGKSEVTLKSVNQIPEEKISRDKTEKETSPGIENTLEKIVDMPLITSSNLIAVIQKSDSLTMEPRASNESYQKSVDMERSGKNPPNERKTGISRSAAVKKTKDTDKPKISMQGSYKQTVNSKNEYIARSNNVISTKVEEKEGVESISNPIATYRETCSVTSVTKNSLANQELKIWNPDKTNVDDLRLENGSDTFSAEVISRELAGEPDGKADEENNVEPPALPRSPPPIETRMKQMTISSSSGEPRNSFLHNVEKKTKPVIPVKPASLPPKSLTITNSITPNHGILNKNFENPMIPRATLRTDEEINAQRQKESGVALGSLQNESEAARRVGAQRLQEPRTEDFVEDDDEDGETFSQLQGDVDSDPVRSANKRRMAPKPPPPSSYVGVDEAGSSLFARNPAVAAAKSDAPVVREKEKRERASSCSPKFRKDTDPDASESVPIIPSGPEPAQRRLISLSQDSLANADKIEEKKKGRSRFSLKKFLRMGSKKDQIDGVVRGSSRSDDVSASPLPTSSPKPRLEIIHPLELGGAVRIVSRDSALGLSEQSQASESSDPDKSHSPSLPSSPSSPSATSTFHHAFARPGKPPPPPRTQSLDDWARLDPANKPARPPPPRAEIKASPKSWQPPSSPTSASDSIYANLAAEDVPGEIRSSLAPSKPQRTASMRDQTISQPLVKKRPSNASARHQDYEAVEVSRSPATHSPMSNDAHGYECLSSSPECDSALDLRRSNANRENVFQSHGKRKSDSSVLDPANDFKYNQSFSRSTSLPYCGSETESELYAPYSFYTGDEGPEEDQDWQDGREQGSKVGRLRRRRGRSIVHRSLEDNYGAVIVANHEALAQVLEQLEQGNVTPPALRGPHTSGVHLCDFSVDRNTCVVIGRRVFYSASWSDKFVTIGVNADHSPRNLGKEFDLVPIVEFTDYVPDFMIERMKCAKKGMEATISVYPHLQMCTIESFTRSLKDTSGEGSLREASFVLLQLVNALKSLQARGVRYLSRELVQAVLCREDKDTCFRLYLLQSIAADGMSVEDEKNSSLYDWVAEALRDLYLTQRLTVVQELLNRERAVTLSQINSVLEFSLWGPADVTLGGPREREVTLQRWLDLERATVLHALIKERAPFAVTDQYHLLFLVRTNAQIMCEASMLLESQRRKMND